MASMGVSELGQMDLFLSMLEWISMAHTTVRCFWLKSYCLSCVRSVASSLSSSKAMYLLTECARQSTYWNETSAFISPDFLLYIHLLFTRNGSIKKEIQKKKNQKIHNDQKQKHKKTNMHCRLSKSTYLKPVGLASNKIWGEMHQRGLASSRRR